jgi:hypothetical protein
MIASQSILDNCGEKWGIVYIVIPLLFSRFSGTAKKWALWRNESRLTSEHLRPSILILEDCQVFFEGEDTVAFEAGQLP